MQVYRHEELQRPLDVPGLRVDVAPASSCLSVRNGDLLGTVVLEHLLVRSTSFAMEVSGVT